MDPEQPHSPLPPPPSRTPALPGPLGLSRAQTSYVAIILALSTMAVLYHWLVLRKLNHSALMFIGLPAVLAIGIALTPRAKTVTGGILKGMTLALLVVAPLLREGMICILMVSPLYFGIGLVVGLVLDHQRKRRPQALSCLALALLPLSVEGTTPGLSRPREESVSVTRVVAASAPEVERSLARAPRLDKPLPRALRLGFPVPLAASGSGATPGDTRRIRFSAAEGKPAGDLVVVITESSPGHLHSTITEDGTKLASWLHWQASDVRWQPVDATHTRVTWTMQFERRLDPAWYFVPFERAAMRQAAAYMIAINATPR